MRRHQAVLWAAVGLIAVVCLIWLAVAVGLLWAVLSPEDWATVTEALGGRIGLLLFLWALALIPIHAALKQLIDRFLRAPAQLAEAIHLRLSSQVDTPIEPGEHPETRQLAELFNTMWSQQRDQQSRMATRIAQVIERSDQERARLSALMSELNRSVVVCNLEGKVLLYNHRARLQFKRLSKAGHVTGGSELIGIGRSIYTVLDQRQIDHALDALERRIKRGASTPSAQFVTATPSGKLFRVQMSPVRVEHQDISGFVLIIENITADMDADLAKDRRLRHLIERGRSHLATLQAGVEALQAKTLNAAEAQRIQAILIDHIQQLSTAMEVGPDQSAEALRRRWPLEDMLAEDFLETLQHRLHAELGLTVTLSGDFDTLWLSVESYTLLQGLMALARRLRDQCQVTALRLRLNADGNHGLLDVAWPVTGEQDSHPPDLSWEQMVIDDGDNGAGTLSLCTVLERHNGGLWLQSESIQAHPHDLFRLRLPLARPQDELPIELLQRHDARPEFYDFDLFKASPQAEALHDQALTALSFTVFDTETTGLNPSGGDEIIQIGAVRIVNGRILRSEAFDQLVDPQRSIPKAGIAIHGITPDQVKGQPTIDEVLPAFHAFCHDTVLVAHNAAFDMKCLAVKQSVTGVCFDHPVLDTLLLSALAHPNHSRHNLDDLAQRFGLTIHGRHTAIGDAMVTAEIVLKLVAVLKDQGIVTLGQALTACEQTWQARVRY